MNAIFNPVLRAFLGPRLIRTKKPLVKDRDTITVLDVKCRVTPFETLTSMQLTPSVRKHGITRGAQFSYDGYLWTVQSVNARQIYCTREIG